jgi:hypothetical protein
VDLQVGNEASVVALTLPSGLILELIIVIIFWHFLEPLYPFLNGFKFIVKGKYCSFNNNNVYYRSGTYTNDLHIPDLEMLRFNTNSKKNILDNQYLYYIWHLKLGQINETRITKLHKEKYLILLIMNHMKHVKLVKLVY